MKCISVESIESYLQIESGNSAVEELSAQHITSCTPNPLQCGGSGGCKGSIPQLGFVYTQLFGLTKEEDYPYTSGTVSTQDSPAKAPLSSNFHMSSWVLLETATTVQIAWIH